jgi:peptidoglycan/LPS O-acetylase OafA/YrhL
MRYHSCEAGSHDAAAAGAGTVGLVLDNHRGVGPGFDFLRIVLALSILGSHSFLITEGDLRAFSGLPLSLLYSSLVPMFFALSGFLVTGSALRLDLPQFIMNRAMRIVPALAVDIFVSALVIGPLFTDLRTQQYFGDPKFARYFANIIGLIHFELPGVFTGNPFPNQVNGSLWTVPFEIGCYAIMAALIVAGLLRRPIATLILSLVAIGGVGPLAEGRLAQETASLLPEATRNALDHFTSDRGAFLYADFLAGSLLYLFRYSIPLRPSFVLLSAASCLAMQEAARSGALGESLRQLLECPAIAYITIFVGLQRMPRLPIFKQGDYSYGIYLYGFPLQQALSDRFPELGAWPHLVASATMASAVAMASWHGVEKPVLTLRRRFSFTGRAIGARAPPSGPATAAIESDAPKREERPDDRPRPTRQRTGKDGRLA